MAVVRGAVVACTTQTQPGLPATSSPDAELRGVSRAAREAIYLRDLITLDFGQLCGKPRLWTDSSSAMQAAKRIGPGAKLRHLEVCEFYVQGAIQSKQLALGKVKGTLNCAKLSDETSQVRDRGKASPTWTGYVRSWGLLLLQQRIQQHDNCLFRRQAGPTKLPGIRLPRLTRYQKRKMGMAMVDAWMKATRGIVMSLRMKMNSLALNIFQRMCHRRGSPNHLWGIPSTIQQNSSDWNDKNWYPSYKSDDMDPAVPFPCMCKASNRGRARRSN